ncbi:U-box domain-containing protein 52-like [Tasmannia lanceolata]|uniref:U-box domain-containing protein 52-like n=1 Tax=Tasmannia lanceolata TaxID=3420 RepID=UPI004062BBE3
MWSGGGNPQNNQDNGLVAIAVDADKNSQQALRWAADNLLSKGQIFVLLHVHRTSVIPTLAGQPVPIEEVDEEVASAFLQQMHAQTKETLLPFQCFCGRRGLQCKEVILDGSDISKAIVDYAVQQSVDKLVLGASSRNAFTRTFKTDVPTTVSKLAPEFCSVYVISKGKMSTFRPAPHPIKNPFRRQLIQKLDDVGNSFQSAKSEPATRPDPEEVFMFPLARSSGTGQIQGGTGPSSYDNIINERIGRFNQGGGPLDLSYQTVSSCPSPSRTSLDRPGNYFIGDRLHGGSRQPRLSNMRDEYSYYDEQRRSFESGGSGGQYWSSGSGFSGYLHSPPVPQNAGGVPWSSSSLEDMEAEMRRLNLELQQKMDMYSGAPIEALNTKQKARDLHSWKVDEGQRMEGARFSEEASFRTAEERPRSKATLETAQAAQKMKDSAQRNVLLEADNKKVLDSMSASVHFKRYTLEEIEKATDYFSESLKIGEGGYGPVFKSNLDHSVVAIKILRSDVTVTQGMKQFQQEVEVLSRIRHPNMVLLIGACPDYGCLVYEYMANGSLEDRLLCQNNTPPLSWQLRFKIAAEIGTGLLHLHQIKPEPLVHRDLKPGNILLDHNFASKIADVGLARLIPTSAADATTQYHMTAAAGTFCYIDPEYQKTGMLGIKSDIYALGIILLQLITARPPMGLAHNIEKAIEMGQLEKMLDPVVPDWPVEDTLRFAKLSLKCAELRQRDRPDLRTVVLPELNRLRALAEENPQISSFFPA